MDKADTKFNIVELDVREQLRKKIEPFRIIMDTVDRLEEDDVFVLHATFKPTPLLGILKMKGYANKVEKKASDHWITAFARKKNAAWLDEALGTEADVAIADGELGSDTDDAGASRVRGSDGEVAPKTYKLNNRGMEPPAPMVRTLTQLERCKPGDTVVIHNDRVPVYLLEELAKLGYPNEIDEQPDGSAIVTIRKT